MLVVQPGLLRSLSSSRQSFPCPNLLHSALRLEKLSSILLKHPLTFQLLLTDSHTSHFTHPHPVQPTSPCSGCLSHGSSSVLLRYRYLSVHIYIYTHTQIGQKKIKSLIFFHIHAEELVAVTAISSQLSPLSSRKSPKQHDPGIAKRKTSPPKFSPHQ